MPIHASLALGLVLALGLLCPGIRPAVAQERIPAPRILKAEQIAVPQVAEQIAAPQQDAVPLPADLALVPGDAALFLSLRVADVYHSKAARLFNHNLEFQTGMKMLAAQWGLSFTDLERVSMVLTKEGAVYLVRTKKPPVRSKVVKATAPRAERTSLKGRSCYINEEDWTAVVWLDGQTLGFGGVSAVEAVLSSSDDKGPFRDAFDEILAGRHMVLATQPGRWVNVCWPQWLTSVYRRPSGSEFAEAEGQLAKARCVLVTAQFGAQDLRIAGRATYARSREATASEEALENLRKPLIKLLYSQHRDAVEADRDGPVGREYALALRRMLRAGVASAKEMSVQRQEAGVTFAVTVQATDTVTALVGLVAETTHAIGHSWAEQWAEHPTTPTTPTALKNLGQAMLAYHKKQGRLPAAALCNKDGKPLLSWRVALLPFLGETALYREFRLDEPWDSEHNRKLIPHMPAVFSKSITERGTPTTVFQAFTGKGTAFEGKKGRSLADFTDGPGQTILIAEAARAVPWTKPEDIPYASARRPDDFGLAPLTPHVVLADGEIQQLPCRKEGKKWVFDGPGGLTAKHLHALITRAGGDQAEARVLLKQCQAAREAPTMPVVPASYQEHPGWYPPPMMGPPPLPGQQGLRPYNSLPMLLPAPFPAPAEPAPGRPREDQPR